MFRNMKNTHLWPKINRLMRERLSILIFLFKSAKNPDEDRFSYQKSIIKHQFTHSERILDIGSGGDPFPYATILGEKYLEPTNHRTSKFKSFGKPIIICDICYLPFIDKSFDYVVASHVLEHVEDPLMACLELQRVANTGFIETPTLMKDALFSWAKGMHKWYLHFQGGRLIFFEYTDRLSEGIRSPAWREMIFSTVYNPLQDVFNDNQEIFNVMFEWEKNFNITVIRKDGSLISNEN